MAGAGPKPSPLALDLTRDITFVAIAAPTCAGWLWP